MLFHSHLESNIIVWMTSIFLTQLTMSVSPAAPAVHEALWKLRSCWRCNDMHVVWLRTAMGFGCCRKNRDQRWMIQFVEITDIYGSYIILSFWIWTDLDEIMDRCSMMFRRLQSVMNLASNLRACCKKQCCCSISTCFLDLTIVWLRMLKQLTPERTSFEHCWIGPSTFQSFTVSTIGTLRSSWEVPGKERCIRGSPKPGNDTESARNGGRGRSISFRQVEEFNYPTILCNNNMSTYIVIFCTCLLFFEFVSQCDTTTKPQCNRVGWRCLYHVLDILLPLHWILCFWCSNHADPWSKWPSVARWSR